MAQAITIIGNLAEDPELRFTSAGKPVVGLRIITSKSRKDPTTNEWTNEDVTGWFATAWDRLAENVAETLQKGDPVMIQGEAKWRGWENKDGTRGGRLEVTAWKVGLDLSRNSATVQRVARQQATPQQGGATSAQARPSSPPPDDPWSNLPAQPPF